MKHRYISNFFLVLILVFGIYLVPLYIQIRFVNRKVNTLNWNTIDKVTELNLNKIGKVDVQNLNETRIANSIGKTSELNMTEIMAWQTGFHEWCAKHQRQNVSFTLYADKHWAKKHVQQLIPNLKVAKEYAFVNNTKDINNELLKSLPRNYVFKANHLSGGIAIVQGKKIECVKSPCRSQGSKNHLQYLKYLCAKWLSTNYARKGELYYRDIHPKCMFEEYLGNDSQLVDYKVMTYHGIPYMIELHADRFTGYSKSYYTPSWNHMKIVRAPRYVPNFSSKKKPVFLQEMLRYSKILSRNFGMIRIDFMSVGDSFVFAEYSPSPASCHATYVPLSVEKFYGYVADHPNRNINPEDVFLFIPK